MWQKEEFVWLVQGQSEGQSLLICDSVCVSVLWGYEKVFLQVGAEWITTWKKNDVYNVFGEQQLYVARGRSLGRSTKKKVPNRTRILNIMGSVHWPQKTIKTFCVCSFVHFFSQDYCGQYAHYKDFCVEQNGKKRLLEPQRSVKRPMQQC